MSWVGKLFRAAGAEVSTDALKPRPDAPQRAADTSSMDEARERPESAQKTRSALDEAGAFLREVLAMGPRPSKEVRAEAEARGISWATLRRATPSAGVKKRKAGFQGRWVLSLQTCSGKAKDAQLTVVSTFAQTEDERTDGLGEAADEVQRGDRNLSEAPPTPARPDPDDVQVPPGFTIPPGTECVRWDLKSAPLKTSRGGTVFDVNDLVKRHLEVLAAKLRGEKGWLFEQWDLATLLADLRDVGVELRIP